MSCFIVAVTLCADTGVTVKVIKEDKIELGKRLVFVVCGAMWTILGIGEAP